MYFYSQITLYIYIYTISFVPGSQVCTSNVVWRPVTPSYAKRTSFSVSTLQPYVQEENTFVLQDPITDIYYQEVREFLLRKLSEELNNIIFFEESPTKDNESPFKDNKNEVDKELSKIFEEDEETKVDFERLQNFYCSKDTMFNSDHHSEDEYLVDKSTLTKNNILQMDDYLEGNESVQSFSIINNNFIENKSPNNLKRNSSQKEEIKNDEYAGDHEKEPVLPNSVIINNENISDDVAVRTLYNDLIQKTENFDIISESLPQKDVQISSELETFKVLKNEEHLTNNENENKNLFDNELDLNKETLRTSKSADTETYNKNELHPTKNRLSKSSGNENENSTKLEGVPHKKSKIPKGTKTKEFLPEAPQNKSSDTNKTKTTTKNKDTTSDQLKVPSKNHGIKRQKSMHREHNSLGRKSVTELQEMSLDEIKSKVNENESHGKKSKGKTKNTAENKLQKEKHKEENVKDKNNNKRKELPKVKNEKEFSEATQQFHHKPNKKGIFNNKNEELTLPSFAKAPIYERQMSLPNSPNPACTTDCMQKPCAATARENISESLQVHPIHIHPNCYRQNYR